MFKVNHEEAGKGFEVIAPGDYEVTVINYEMKKATTGNNVISVDYELRSDVQQPHQGQKILYDNFTITEKAMWKVQAVSKAAKFPHGMEFGSYKEWADTLLNKNLILTIKHKAPDANENVYPEVKGYKESKANNPTSQSSGPITVSDDELPF